MDEMTAFDRQISREAHREVGPSEPVDGAAIFAAITATQSPKWRFQSMFSATKFVVAGAIVALFGGFLLAGVLTQPREDESVPAAVVATPSADQTDAGSWSIGAVDFTGTIPRFVDKGGPEYLLAEDGFAQIDGTLQASFTDMDDPRLNGRARIVVNRIVPFGAGNVVSYVLRIDNDDGSWLGTGHGYFDTSDPAFQDDQKRSQVADWLDTTVFRGTGGYTGLSAIMVNESTERGVRVSGAVFNGEIPELPEMPTAPE